MDLGGPNGSRGPNAARMMGSDASESGEVTVNLTKILQRTGLPQIGELEVYSK